MKTYPPIVIQNADVTVTGKDFPLVTDELRVFSRFSTIQGEGPWAGMPAYFIRLAGCNYGKKSVTGPCAWCDTKFDMALGVQTKFFDLIQSVREAKATRIVVTGGEPCLQKSLISFCHMAHGAGFEVQIETNGSQLAVMKACKEAGALVVCSPKASAKGWSDKTSLTADHATCLKFVVNANPENVHSQVPAWAKSVGLPIYVSPMTMYKRPYAGEVSSAWDPDLVDQEATRANYRYAAELAMANNYIVSIQMHTFLEMA